MFRLVFVIAENNEVSCVFGAETFMTALIDAADFIEIFEKDRITLKKGIKKVSIKVL